MILNTTAQVWEKLLYMKSNYVHDNHLRIWCCFFSIRFSFTDTDDSQDSRGSEGTIFYSTLPLPPAHEHWNIYLQLSMWDDYHVFLIATLVFTRLLLDEIYHLIELPFEWLFDDSMFVCLLDELILGLSYSDLTWETGGLELVSTITPVLLANRLTKCASHPKCANWCPHFWPIISSYLHSHFFDVEQVIIHYGCFEKIFVQVLPKWYKPERWYMI